MWIALAVVVSVASIAFALWSMRQVVRLNRELDDKDVELARLEAETATMLRDATRRVTEEVGQ